MRLPADRAVASTGFATSGWDECHSGSFAITQVMKLTHFKAVVKVTAEQKLEFISWKYRSEV